MYNFKIPIFFITAFNKFLKISTVQYKYQLIPVFGVMTEQQKHCPIIDLQ